MVYRRLGRSGLHVSAIGLGGWMTIGGYAADEASFACMKKAYDLGVNFFDNAENYTAGESEIVMGKAIKHFGWKRSDLVISTSKVTHGNMLPWLVASSLMGLGLQKSTGEPSMARSSSITTACRGSTSSRG